MPRVSIIIPTYNRAEVICQALDSIFAQTYKDFEVIVVDEEPSDSTEELVRNYPENVVYIKRRCGRPSVARNIGIKMAKGEYVAFLDSDDVWFPEKLEAQVKILDRLHDMGLVCSNAIVLGRDGKKSKYKSINDDQDKSGNLLNDLLEDNFVVTSSVIARKSLIEGIGCFPEIAQLRVGEDYDTWLRASAVSKCYYISRPMLVYRADTGISSGKTEQVHMRLMLIILNRLREFLDSVGYKDTFIRYKIGRTLAAFQFNLYFLSKNYVRAALCIPRWAYYRALIMLYGLKIGSRQA